MYVVDSIITVCYYVWYDRVYDTVSYRIVSYRCVVIRVFCNSLINCISQCQKKRKDAKGMKWNCGQKGDMINTKIQCTGTRVPHLLHHLARSDCDLHTP